MAGAGWRKDRALIEQLYAESYRFDFFQAVRLLESLAVEPSELGEGAHAEREAVNFRSSLGAVFPASEVDDLTRGDPAAIPPEMTVNFFGLGGAFGPMPRPFTEQLLAQVRRHDTAGRDFLDIFNHRLVSLFYRVRRHHRPALSRGGPERSELTRPLLALIGLATTGLQGRLDTLPDRALLEFAGLFAIAPRSLHALERAVAAHFGVRVTGEPLTGRWIALGDDQQTRLGASGKNSRLGDGFVLGARFWDQAGAIRLTLGPLDFVSFRRFLPVGDSHRPLRALIDFASDKQVDCDLILVLMAAEIPRFQLSAADGARLGWTSWLATRPARRDAVVTLRQPVLR
jgi:type VI secretion system protein ImpH